MLKVIYNEYLWSFNYTRPGANAGKRGVANFVCEASHACDYNKIQTPMKGWEKDERRTLNPVYFNEIPLRTVWHYFEHFPGLP